MFSPSYSSAILAQRLPDEKYLVNSESDLIYFRTVADAVCKRYPTSPFVVTLRNDVARMEAQTSLLNTIEERDYPDIVADDMYGNKVKLSEFEGNVILVDFWALQARILEWVAIPSSRGSSQPRD